jgi:hypothetical protein
MKKGVFLQEPHGVTTQKTPFFYISLIYEIDIRELTLEINTVML